jgi:hypothetical protein
MKIIITESQYKMLLESNIESMQSLIDMAYEELKNNCEEGSYIRSHINSICGPVDTIEEIKVVDSSRGSVMNYQKNKIEVINISVDCYIDSIFQYYNLDNFLYELQEEAKNIIGVPVIITKRKTINKRKNFDW